MDKEDFQEMFQKIWDKDKWEDIIIEGMKDHFIFGTPIKEAVDRALKAKLSEAL